MSGRIERELRENWEKSAFNLVREKSNIFLSFIWGNAYSHFLFTSIMLLLPRIQFYILLPHISLWDRAFVNKSVTLSFDRTFWILIAPLFWKLWVKNFENVCYALSSSIYIAFNGVMQVVISSYKLLVLLFD